MDPLKYVRFKEKNNSITAIVTEKDIEIGRFLLDLNSQEDIKKAEALGVDMKYAHYLYEYTK